jgi:4-methyl-5(b-hydroxyethyl)-thiazole monophosphate biosynthesis
MRSACVLLAPGFEEIEAITVIDVLRRADVETAIVAVDGREVTGSHGITVVSDIGVDVAFDRRWDLVVLPGGMPGATNLRDHPRVQALVRAQRERGGLLAAICAGPIALAKAGALEGRRATSYPGFGPMLGAIDYREEAVVDDGEVITSRGPGTALAFALHLVERLVGAPARAALADRMLVDA